MRQSDAIRIDLPERRSSGSAPGGRLPNILLAIKVLYGVLFAYSLYRLNTVSISATVGALLIGVAALLPAYLWASGFVRGLPILPLHTLALTWTFGLPLVAGQAELLNYDEDELLFASLCVILYALSAMITWLLATRRWQRVRAAYFVLPNDRGYSLLVAALWGAGIFILLVVGQAIELEAGIFAIVRSSIIAIASIAMFGLSVRLGRGALSGVQKWLFILTATFFVIIHILTIYLVGAIVSVAIAFVGYTVGARRVPWGGILAAFLVFSVLHGGKAQMRERYWNPDPQMIPLVQVPAFLSEWVWEGVREFAGSGEQLVHQPIHERLSLMHLLLLAQRSLPQHVPYLEGATYEFIPRLLIPRLFDPDKPSSHEGTIMLNMHFGLQSLEDTERTTIGWGMLNEGFANFGLIGVIGVGSLIGLLFGFAGRLTVDAPTMSLENLVGVTFAAVAIQSEFTMAVFVASLFQALVALVFLLPFLVKQRSPQLV
jgi:hypothetical protein